MTPERFRGRTTAEALDAVKRALGEDAVLLETATAADGAIEILAGPPLAAHAADDPAVEVVVGPPGDGKTTVLGKLAVAARRAGRPVVLVATDTRRLGGSAELDALGRALGVPVLRATAPAVVATAIARHAGAARALVDTTDVGPSQAAILAEVAALVRACGEHARRTLVVSATTVPTVTAATLEAFAIVAPTCAVVTKADLAPWEPPASQIAGHGIAVVAVARSRSVADPLTAIDRRGLARRLLAA